MILSFSWTTDAFLDGRKTVTRRRWAPRHMATWQRTWDQGRHVHDAWDRLPIAGGRPIGRFRLTCRPYWERLADMPEEDLAAEGGYWASKAEFLGLFGGDPEQPVAVVRFERLAEEAISND